jgi:hypothetical protein
VGEKNEKGVRFCGRTKDKKLGAFVCGMRKQVVGARRQEKVRVFFGQLQREERRCEAKSVRSREKKSVAPESSVRVVPRGLSFTIPLQLFEFLNLNVFVCLPPWVNH